MKIQELKDIYKDNISINNELYFWTYGGSILFALSTLSESELLIGGTSGIVLYNMVKKFLEVKKNWDGRNNQILNSKEYLEAYKSYLLVLDELSKLFENLDWDNEMKLFSGYSYLLKKGYLSVDCQFNYSRNISSCSGLWGSNILLGEGNCKHISSMLTDILKVNGYDAHNIGMLLDKEDIYYFNDIDFSYSEEDDIDLDNRNNYDFRKRLKNRDVPNHLVTLFKDNDHSYIMDATNDTIYIVDSDLSVYQGKYQFKIFDYDKTKGLIPTDVDLFTQRLGDYYDVLSSCFELTSEFEKFYFEHKDLYDEVIAKRKTLIRNFNKYNIYDL